MAYLGQSHYEDALTYFHQTVEIARKKPDIKGEGMALNGMGEAYRNQGLFAEALQCYTQAIRLLESMIILSQREGTASILVMCILIWGNIPKPFTRISKP
jgi:tetratricopeptide (TPR) repeat protein